MSGKPASVGVPGAPRVLVYVEPRPLAPGAAPPHAPRALCLPAAAPLYRPDRRALPALPAALYYKSADADNTVSRSDFYQPYVKEAVLKTEDSVPDGRSGLDGKRDGVDEIGPEYSTAETFLGGVPVDVEPGSYSARCTGPPDGALLRHAQNQYSESVTVHSADIADRGSASKSFVNYQFLEQSVSHQSIVNQSISILNQQVGVSRGVVSEGDGGSSPQLVRTADGVVLAVVSAPVGPQPVDPVDNRTVLTDTQQTITVPLGWRRIVTGTSVLYISPSGTALSTLPQLREYLQTAGTCKCGLPCPLRPETAFSFDSKVVSKPYQVASGAELTKLCNHKRKLLASLQARGQSPATPPPQNIDQKKATGTEVALLKKKMKKRPGFPANMSVSQLMVQRERPLAEFKSQEELTQTAMGHSRPTAGCLPSYPTQQTPQHAAADFDPKQDTQVQRSNHYLTVNNGWITQHTVEAQKPAPSVPVPGNNTHPPVGVPVRGANGQIIGVNTCYKYNYRGPLPTEPERKDDRKEPAPQHSTERMTVDGKGEESQIFCGLNQALTPEVMRKINEQQQIFIQQNQKQIEMARYRSQLAENANQSKTQGRFAQAQPIQNGALVKTNPAKTPPWQVKRTEGDPVTMTSPNPKLPKPENVDYDESNATMSEDSSSSFSSFSSNEQATQGMCPRVPPLPQHYNAMGQQWPPAETNKRKGKGTKGKKKSSPTENKIINFGMRPAQDQKGNVEATDNVPSFMDDPSGYLAQQTALLNNTISRQVGATSGYDGTRFDGTNGSHFIQQHQHRLTPNEIPIYRNDAMNASPSPNTTPDSSVVSDKAADASCCKGCNPTSEGSSPDYADRRLGYLKHNMYKMELSDQTSLKRGFDESPVTSSTFIERGQGGENCSPIQAGTVSTSNVSHTETLQPPEPSPTSSNSSRSADTPHSHSGNNAVQPNGAYLSPAYANNCRDGYNPSVGAPVYHYNSPGPPGTQAATGTQMMHFISNHNVNKNLMEVDNISMVGVKPTVKAPEGPAEPRRRIENSMPGYCPPPHMGGGPAHSLIQACYIQTFVTTMASGFSVTRDTVTSVLAGRANTVTTSINASRANFVRPPPPPSVDLASTYAIPNNQPDPFLNSVNLPTSYPLHIAGTTAQTLISKSPLEMVQNVIGNIPPRSEPSPAAHHHPGKRAPPGQILISSTGQIIVSSERMPPPPPKVSCGVGAGAGEVALAPPAVMVSSLPAPYVLQPPMMSVEGQVVTAPPADAPRQIDIKTHHAYVQGVAMLSPEISKKRSKKKKSPTSVTNVLQITAPQQNTSNIMVHSSPQHNTSPQFSPRGFQLSPSGNMSPTPMLQALTIVPGKSGSPAHIVMNGQGGANGFGSQQIIANASPSQQINLLQPVNLINNAGGVVSNFPFQQFIVPNLGGMVMTTDGAAIIQDNSTGMPMQLQLQTVNGQSVLTPVQNQGMFAAAGGNGGVVLRAQNHQGKMIQSQHSPGAQFLSPNHQVVVNGPGFNGQLSPLLANLSPTNVTFGGQQVRSGNVQTQEFIQTNRMGQALMVPLSPKRQLTNNRANSTFVQNTTIVQQQTTLVSNGQMSGVPPSARLSIDPTALLGKTSPPKPRYEEEAKAEKAESREYAKLVGELNACEFVRHSVSTQTRARTSPARLGGSPPDTTTHSPLGAEPEYAAECRRAPPPAHPLADTTTSSPEPPDANSSAMVQCVSSSEQDMADSREHAWPAPRNDFTADSDGQNMMSMQMMRQRPHNPVESSEILYNQAVGVPQSHNQHVMPMASNYYDRNQAYKRKNDFGDGSTYRSDKIMRTNTYNIVHTPKDNEYDIGMVADKNQRHYQPSGSSSDPLQKVFDRHHLGSSDDGEGEPGEVVEEGNEGRGRKFEVGELVWGPVKGYSSWPGKLRARAADGRWTVHWFGADKPPCDVTPARLLTLSEGLEAHHAARTKHRKSRKLNTLLENAIQEAMSELDKKSDPSSSEAGPSTEPAEVEPISDTPRRKKLDKLKTKDKHHKKTPVRIAPNPHKPVDGARLRSAR